MIGPGETCRIFNKSDTSIKIGWGNIEYIVPPQEERYVPTDAVINFFGDPRSVNTMTHIEGANGIHSWVPDRASEVRRLRVKWARFNIHNGEDELECPQVDVFDLEGVWQPMVSNDPSGEHVNPANLSASDQYDRDAVIARMQNQLEQLIKEQTIQNEIQPVTVESEIPVDSPTASAREKKTVTARAANDE